MKSLLISPTLSLHRLALFSGLTALAIVGSAWVFQLIGYVPCQVCLWQRVPYYIAGPLLIIGGAMSMRGMIPDTIVRTIIVLGAAIIAVSGLIGIYHSGVEWGYWPGPESCGVGGVFTASDADDLFNSLASTKPPACDEAAGRFLGLSFAGWNVIAAFGLAAMMLWALKRAANPQMAGQS
ncbi:MAG: disulfide bond formation protein B, partial [Pseudomonadota bacterium]